MAGDAVGWVLWAARRADRTAWTIRRRARLVDVRLSRSVSGVAGCTARGVRRCVAVGLRTLALCFVMKTTRSATSGPACCALVQRQHMQYMMVGTSTAGKDRHKRGYLLASDDAESAPNCQFSRARESLLMSGNHHTYQHLRCGAEHRCVAKTETGKGTSDGGRSRGGGGGWRMRGALRRVMHPHRLRRLHRLSNTWSSRPCTGGSVWAARPGTSTLGLATCQWVSVHRRVAGGGSYYWSHGVCCLGCWTVLSLFLGCFVAAPTRAEQGRWVGDAKRDKRARVLCTRAKATHAVHDGGNANRRQGQAQTWVFTGI